MATALTASIFAHGEDKAPRYLVLYYSQCGSTKVVADELTQRLNADKEAIEALVPYDGTYQETIERCKRERAEGTIPVVSPVKADLSQYDAIFLGYPIWFGTYAPPVAGMLKDVDLNKKTVIPFCTFGSGGLESSVRDLAKAQPGAVIKEGYGVRTARINAVKRELNRFLIENGYVDGDITPLPDYSAPVPVTDSDKAVFDAACSGYKFPLGTPQTVSRRQGDQGEDLRFNVISTTPDGATVPATIYITITPGSTPEFTRVVR
jgi:flavodoxin